jgi:hypothetical protein
LGDSQAAHASRVYTEKNEVITKLQAKQLPSQKFAEGKELSPKRLQEYHEANLQDTQNAVDSINTATAFHLGVKDVDFQISELVTQYPDGQVLTFTTSGGELHFGRIQDGELYGTPMVRIS